MLDIVVGDDPAKIGERAAVEGDGQRNEICLDEPSSGLPQRNAAFDQDQADDHQPHPDERGDAQFGERVGLYVKNEPKDGGRHEHHVLGDPQMDERPDEPRPAVAAARVGRCDQHQNGRQ